TSSKCWTYSRSSSSLLSHRPASALTSFSNDSRGTRCQSPARLIGVRGAHVGAAHEHPSGGGDDDPTHWLRGGLRGGPGPGGRGTGGRREGAAGRRREGVKDAVKARYPKAEIVSASKGDHDGTKVYEFELKQGDKTWEASFTLDGKFDSSEEVIKESELPKKVKEAFRKKYKDAKMETI